MGFEPMINGEASLILSIIKILLSVVFERFFLLKYVILHNILKFLCIFGFLDPHFAQSLCIFKKIDFRLSLNFPLKGKQFSVIRVPLIGLCLNYCAIASTSISCNCIIKATVRVWYYVCRIWTRF